MRINLQLFSFVLLTFALSSCEFKCNVGKPANETKDGDKKPMVKNGTTISNNINLNSQGLKITKAYLMLDNGERVPDNNYVDFAIPVKMIVLIDSGWTVVDDKVWLGASEKITAENGNVLLDEPDLFKGVGITPEDSKILALKAKIILPAGSQPTSFRVSFKIWDKNGEAYLEGDYQLSSK